MALKPDRHEFKTDISSYCNSATERGVILVYYTSGSGVALDQSTNVVTLPGTGVLGQKPAGLLLNDMVEYDATRYHINYLKDEMRVGGKCTLLQQGWVVTNKLAQGITPVAGDAAYLSASGLIGTASGPTRVGTFLSGKDENNYAKVEIDLPA